jgi:hypothetical protein
VVEVAGGARIELDAVDLPLRVGAGVTLQSSRGGRRPGGLLRLRHIDPDTVAIRLVGDGARVRNLRLQGPSAATGKVGNVTGIAVDGSVAATIEGTELSGWPMQAVRIDGRVDSDVCSPSPPTRPYRVRVIGNSFHHNQMAGKGYGVKVVNDANASIEGNTFDWNRHAISADGSAGTGFLAAFNYVLSGGHRYGGWRGPFNYVYKGYYEQHFDMHGTGSHGYGGVSGEHVWIVGNTMHGDQKYGGGLGIARQTRPAYFLRGRPCGRHEFHGNVLVHERDKAVRAEHGGDGKVAMSGNRFATDTSWSLGVGDFDRDGRDDLFQATGAAWYYSSGGQAEWRLLQRGRTEPADHLRFGDFDRDRVTDVFTSVGGKWLVSRSGREPWETLATSPHGLDEVLLGDFDGDRRTDVFRASGTRWYYAPGGRADLEQRLSASSTRVDDVRLGDFDGDARTDVLAIQDGAWAVKYGAPSASCRLDGGPWCRLNELLARNLRSLTLADFDGNGRTDIAQSRMLGNRRGNDRTVRIQWRMSHDGTGPWRELRTFTALSEDRRAPLEAHWIGSFDSRAGADALRYTPPATDSPTRARATEGVDLVRSSGGASDYRAQSRQGMR